MENNKMRCLDRSTKRIVLLSDR